MDPADFHPQPPVEPTLQADIFRFVLGTLAFSSTHANQSCVPCLACVWISDFAGDLRVARIWIYIEPAVHEAPQIPSSEIQRTRIFDLIANWISSAVVLRLNSSMI